MFKSLKILILVIVAVVHAGAAAGQTEVEATAGWSPPTYGTPVVHYVIQHSLNDGAWTTVGTTEETSFTFLVSFADDHRVRVAGVDAEGRQGPYSLPSNSYNPSDGAVDGPAQPGQPMLF